MKPLENNSFFEKKDKLSATLISGVNGVGKTTTIGKIGKILKANGNKVMFAASDTFRAAAIEQLENWAKKIDVEIVKSSQGSDPASVAYKAVDQAIKNNRIKPDIPNYETFENYMNEKYQGQNLVAPNTTDIVSASSKFLIGETVKTNLGKSASVLSVDPQNKSICVLGDTIDSGEVVSSHDKDGNVVKSFTISSADVDKIDFRFILPKQQKILLIFSLL